MSGSLFSNLTREEQEMIKNAINEGKNLLVNYENTIKQNFVRIKELELLIAKLDHDNIYAKLFNLACGNAYKTLGLKEFTEMFECNENEIDYYVFEIMLAVVNRKLKSCSTDFSDIKYYRNTELLCGISNYFEIYRTYQERASTLIKSAYDISLKDYINVVAKLYQVTCKHVESFIYTVDNLKCYSFDHLTEEVVLLNDLHYYVKRFNDNKINGICQQINRVARANSNAILSYSLKSGEKFLKICSELVGPDRNGNGSNLDYCVWVEDCWCCNRKIRIKLSTDGMTIYDFGPDRFIRYEDMFFINHSTYCYRRQDGVYFHCDNYDLLYKLSSTTYTLIHFGVDVPEEEDHLTKEKIKIWAERINLQYQEIEYEDNNPFISGFNTYTYVNTMSAYAKGPKIGCYTATCVYKSYDCPEVWALRRYRDNYLDNRWWGRLFIKFYYAVGPIAVKLFGKMKWFNKIVKSILDKKVKKLRDAGYEDTPYNDKY